MDSQVIELKYMIASNKTRTEDRYVFLNEDGSANIRARKIGVELWNYGGDYMLHIVMTELIEFVNEKIQKGCSWMSSDLRQLEFAWNGIGDWMA